MSEMRIMEVTSLRADASVAPFRAPSHQEQQRLLATAHRLRAEAIAGWWRALVRSALVACHALAGRAQRALAVRRDAV